MSLSRFDTFARSVVGPSAAGAQVFLCLQPAVTNSLPPSPLAQLYSDPLGANPISQPLICDGFGHASCYVSSGTFTEVVVYGGMLVQVYPDQFISSTIAVQVNGLEVNGNPVTGPNFNSTVPATPVGSTTVIWQFDGLGNVTGSIPTSIYAPIASPAFTGTPTAPTPASSDDSNTIATTAYVQSVLAGSGLVVSVFGRTGAVEATSGDYTVAQITGAAPLASPALTGTPTAPTPATANSSTLLATTAFVKAQGYGVGSVTTFSAANIGGIATASVTNPTSTPALTFTLEAQAANTVWAGPATGSNAAPTFRALVASDLPAGGGGSPGGISGQVQFNKSGAFGGQTAAGSYMSLDTDIPDGFYIQDDSGNNFIVGGTSNSGVAIWSTASQGIKLRLAGGAFLSLSENTFNLDSSSTAGLQTNFDSSGVIVEGSLQLTGKLFDGGDSPGTSGNVLSSTGTATAWVTPASLTAAPATASSSGTAGEIAYDATHFYVCISTNSWVRATFAAW